MGTIQSTLCNPSPVYTFARSAKTKNNAGKCPALPLFNSISAESATSPSSFFVWPHCLSALPFCDYRTKTFFSGRSCGSVAAGLALPGIRCQGRPASAFFSSFFAGQAFPQTSFPHKNPVKHLSFHFGFLCPISALGCLFSPFLILHCFFVLFYSLYCQTSTPPANTFAIPARAVFLHKKRTRIARSFAFFIFPPVSHL